MVEHNIGAVVVSEGVGVQGILSERGVLRLTAESPSLLSTTLIRDSMTVDVIVAAKSDSVPQVMDVMTAKRIRHLPVVEGGLLEGIVSIGDLVNALRSKAEDEKPPPSRLHPGRGFLTEAICDGAGPAIEDDESSDDLGHADAGSGSARPAHPNSSLTGPDGDDHRCEVGRQAGRHGVARLLDVDRPESRPRSRRRWSRWSRTWSRPSSRRASLHRTG